MGQFKLYCAGTAEATRNAASIIKRSGFPIAQSPGADITDLLLDVPSFRKDGELRDGEDPEALFSRLPRGCRIWGGNLNMTDGFTAIDLLQDPGYLAENAAITAECALKIAAPILKTIWKHTHVLIIGWGRIGKQLSKMLKSAGAAVTVCARKSSDRALVRAFGYGAADIQSLPHLLSCSDVIFNTAPAHILEADIMDAHPACIAIDLASIQGLEGSHVIWARGLPGKLAPKASGQLIAETILRKGKEVFPF